IFFHSSECKDFKNLNLGDDVEFTIQIRNNKEVAINIVHLPLGTVVFDDVSKETVMGHVIKMFDKLQTRHPEPMSGKIRYRRDSREMEISFGEKDTKGDFTLQVGDWVQFNIATDRRDKLQHATNIDLLDESFLVSGEMREQVFCFCFY
ncbi:cold shock domain-containing protein E1-like, partial [Centruroides sculpturatus]|uniref:cold shock domain-containing protein E1-like n=1 Tax=Centruroides sculpturatus TaxID=218467 RepID=UPI000C6E461C